VAGGLAPVQNARFHDGVHAMSLNYALGALTLAPLTCLVRTFACSQHVCTTSAGTSLLFVNVHELIFSH